MPVNTPLVLVDYRSRCYRSIANNTHTHPPHTHTHTHTHTCPHHTQLEDGHTLFDYDVGLNEIVQLLIRNIPVESKVTASDQSGESKAENEVGADGDDMDTVSCVCGWVGAVCVWDVCV